MKMIEVCNMPGLGMKWLRWYDESRAIDGEDDGRKHLLRFKTLQVYAGTVPARGPSVVIAPAKPEQMVGDRNDGCYATTLHLVGEYLNSEAWVVFMDHVRML